MSIRKFDLREVVRPGRWEEFIAGRTSPYHLEESLREDTFVDESKEQFERILKINPARETTLKAYEKRFK